MSPGDVAANWPAQMTIPASPFPGRRGSQRAQLHRAPDEIIRNGDGWATPALIGSRVHLVDVAELLSDAIAARARVPNGSPSCQLKLAHAGQLLASARLLAARSVAPARAALNPKACVHNGCRQQAYPSSAACVRRNASSGGQVGRRAAMRALLRQTTTPCMRHPEDESARRPWCLTSNRATLAQLV